MLQGEGSSEQSSAAVPTDGDSDFGDDSASATLTVLVPDGSLSMQVRNFNGGTFASSVEVQNGAQLEIRWTLAASTASAARPFVTLTNTAQLSNTVDADPSNNSASIAVNVRRPDVSLFMGVREPTGNGAFGLSVSVARGAALEIEWRVAISKAGIVPITVTDTLPAGLTFIGTTSVPGGSHSRRIDPMRR